MKSEFLIPYMQKGVFKIKIILLYYIHIIKATVTGRLIFKRGYELVI